MSSMSMRGNKRTRPLGSLRHMIPPDESKVQLPRLSIPSKSPDEEKLDEHYSGIQGNAMTLPTPKETTRVEERRKSLPVNSKEPKNQSVPKPASASSNSAVSHEACEKELKEVLGRERDLKDTLAHLQKQVEQLTAQVSEKNTIILTLTTDMEDMEKKHKEQLQEEQTSHSLTQQELESTQKELQETFSRLEAIEKESKEKLDLLRLNLTRQMTELEEAKDKVIADRDQKLNRLKMQMADALKGNSWERQQQLEELTKDLARVQEEADMLRSKLKSVSKGKPNQGQCGNCAESAARIDKLAASLKERDATIKELKSLSAKFEKQLTQQDVLLKQSMDGKGRKIEIPK